MSKRYAPSPDLTETEIDALMIAPLSDDRVAAIFQPEPEIETISLIELLLLGIEPRFERIAAALETANKIKTADRNDIVGLTAQVNRLADAFEAMAGVMGCITARVEGADGVTRGYVRHDRTTNGILSFADDRDDGED
jgi:hypothetical protein